MNREYFESLPIEQVGHACFEPMVPIYQNGARGMNQERVSEYRKSFFQSLSKPQQALFIFYTYYDHAIKSGFEMALMTKQYVQTSIFSALKAGVAFFQDNNMLRLLSDLEEAAAYGSLNNQPTIDIFYTRLQEFSPMILKIIGQRIRENPMEFVQIED